MKQFLRRIRKAGGEITIRKGGHIYVTREGKPDHVVMSSSPSDHRAYQNTRSRLRRKLQLEI